MLSVQFGNNWIRKNPDSVLGMFLIQLFPNWTAFSSMTYMYIMKLTKSSSPLEVTESFDSFCSSTVFILHLTV